MPEKKEKGVHVGSGGFRVDRARMLKQLARFGFLHGHQVVVALARCAVLGKAARLGIKGLVKEGFSLTGYDGLEIEFDGEPFAEASLRHPYDCLFADCPDRRRRSQLARALLTLSEAEPSELTVTSGPAGKRFELSVRSAAEETLRRVEGAGSTIVRVAWEGFGVYPPGELLHGLAGLVEKRLRHAPITVDLRGVWLGQGEGRSRHDISLGPSGPGAAAHESFDRGGTRGRVEMPMRPAPSAGRVALCWAGALVERVPEAAFLPVPVDGFLDHAGFNLDLSAGAVVRDEEFEAGVAALAAEAIALAARSAREHQGIMAGAAALLRSPANREIWAGTLNGRISGDPEASWWDSRWTAKKALEERHAVYRAAARTRWLRYCARAVASRAAGPELDAALNAAPLYFSTALEPLSVDRLRGTMARLGMIPASARFGATNALYGPVLWLSSTRDAALLPDGLKLRRLR